MAAHSYDEALAIIQQLTQQLTIEEQLKIMEELLSAFRQKIVAAPLQVNKEATQPEIVEPSLHSIMEFEGLGKEVWEGIDVEEYLNEERNSWDR